MSHQKSCDTIRPKPYDIRHSHMPRRKKKKLSYFLVLSEAETAFFNVITPSHTRQPAQPLLLPAQSDARLALGAYFCVLLKQF